MLIPNVLWIVRSPSILTLHTTNSLSAEGWHQCIADHIAQWLGHTYTTKAWETTRIPCRFSKMEIHYIFLMHFKQKIHKNCENHLCFEHGYFSNYSIDVFSRCPPRSQSVQVGGSVDHTTEGAQQPGKSPLMPGGFHGGSPKAGWFINVYHGKPQWKWMIWGYPHFRKPLFDIFSICLGVAIWDIHSIPFLCPPWKVEFSSWVDFISSILLRHHWSHFWIVFMLWRLIG